MGAGGGGKRMAQSFAEALGWVPKTRHLAGSFARAHEFARAQGHPTVTLEHLLAALCEDPEAEPVLQSSAVALNRLNADISAFLAALPAGDAADPAADSALIRILEYAVAAAQQSRRREVNGAIVLAAMVGEGKSRAAEMLKSNGLTFESAIKALQRSSVPPRVAQPEALSELPGLGGGAPSQTEPIAAASRATEELLAGARMRVKASRPGPNTIGTDTMSGTDMLGALSEATAPKLQPLPPAPPPARTSGAYDAFRDDLARRAPEPMPEQGWAPQPAPAPNAYAPPARPPRMPPPLAPMPPAPQQTSGLGYPQEATARIPSPDVPWTDPRPTLEPLQRTPVPPRPILPDGDYDAEPAAVPPSRRPSRRPAGANRASAQLDPAELAKSIPRQLRVATSELIEIRVPKAAIALMADGAGMTRAMSVRLRAPEGGFTVETASPETQWVDGQLSLLSDDEASWRWSITPTEPGSGRLQLVISTRSLGEDGQAVEQALPDHIVDVRVRRNVAMFGRRLMGWIVAAVIGAAIARYGETLLDVGVNALRQIASVK